MRRTIAVMLLSIASAAGAQTRGSVGTAGTDTSHVYFEFQVDRPVQRSGPSVKPTYPQALRSLRAEAEVQVQYVVDTLGLADVATFKVLQSPNELFATAVRDVLPRRRYVPAQLKGRKVRQWVSERILFTPPN